MKSYLMIAAVTAFLSSPAMAASNCDDEAMQPTAAAVVSTPALPAATDANAAPAAPSQNVSTVAPDMAAVVTPVSYMKSCKDRHSRAQSRRK
jgi:hypothetical protein